MGKRFEIINEEEKIVNKTYDEYVVSERWKKYRSEDYFEYRRKWYDNPANMIVGDFPIHLDVEITNFCNLGCPMCPRTVQIKEGIFGKVEHIDFNLFKKLIDEGAENGLCSVKFNYLGEPLMHPRVAEMVKYCKDRGILDVMFNTNGVLLKEKMSYDLLEAGIDGIFISFDSVKKEEYESIRVGAKFEDVVNNVKQFTRIRNSNEKFFGTQIRISKILLPTESEQDLLDYIKFWEDHVDVIGFGSLLDLEGSHEMPYNPKYRCDQPWQRLFVRQDGIIFPCCIDSKKNYVLGNAFQESIREVWNGEKLNSLRKAHKCGRYNEIGMCKNCEYLCGISIKVSE